MLLELRRGVCRLDGDEDDKPLLKTPEAKAIASSFSKFQPTVETWYRAFSKTLFFSTYSHVSLLSNNLKMHDKCSHARGQLIPKSPTELESRNKKIAAC